MTKANYPLRLQPSLKSAAQRIAMPEGTSVNQFINVAVAEKIAAMETEVYFTERARKGSRASFLTFLDGAADNPPDADIGE